MMKFLLFSFYFLVLIPQLFSQKKLKDNEAFFVTFEETYYGEKQNSNDAKLLITSNKESYITTWNQYHEKVNFPFQIQKIDKNDLTNFFI